jgi:hypothetical protein
MQKWIQAKKGRMWQEGGDGRKRDNECYNETKNNSSWGVLPGARPERGHHTPDVKAASEILCDYVWDKL